METTLIEKLDKARYNLVKWLTIGWAIWFGTYILKDIITTKTIIIVLIWIGLIGWTIFTINLINFLKLNRKVKKDNKLQEALGDELNRFNMYKSHLVGYWSVICTIAIFFGFSIFFDISALFVTEITLYIGVLSALAASLYYNKD